MMRISQAKLKCTLRPIQQDDREHKKPSSNEKKRTGISFRPLSSFLKIGL